MSASLEHCHASSNNNKEERPRFFDTETKKECWANADVVPGRHPDRWRKDAAGNIVCKRFHNCDGSLGYQYDHKKPYSKGGESTVENCQVLGTRANRLKADKDCVDYSDLRRFSNDSKYTDEELDNIERAVYGDVIPPDILPNFAGGDHPETWENPYFASHGVDGIAATSDYDDSDYDYGWSEPAYEAHDANYHGSEPVYNHGWSEPAYDYGWSEPAYDYGLSEPTYDYGWFEPAYQCYSYGD